jgi:hypothetical protein
LFFNRNRFGERLKSSPATIAFVLIPKSKDYELNIWTKRAGPEMALPINDDFLTKASGFDKV